MAKKENCEYCGRPIKGEPEIKILRSVEHVYCSDFCFKLDFYDAPTLTFGASA
jgi:ribosome-binding protein aMBF1 (putative translation factor)